MTGLFTKHISIKDGLIVKKYPLIDIVGLDAYTKALKNNRIKVADIVDINIQDNTTTIHQKYIPGDTLSQYILHDALNNKRLSSRCLKKFNQFNSQNQS